MGKETYLTDKQLTALGFNLQPLICDDEQDKDFAYRVAKIDTSTSFLEIINEYRNGKITNQYTNYFINEDGHKQVDVILIKKLKDIILNHDN